MFAASPRDALPGDDRDTPRVTDELFARVEVHDPGHVRDFVGPSGPVPARISLRTSCGSSAAITWAIMPPSRRDCGLSAASTDLVVSGPVSHDLVHAVETSSR